MGDLPQAIHHHIGDAVPGIVGTTVAGGLTVMGFVVNAIPILQAISLIMGISVAIVTFVYYQRKIQADRLLATAALAAAALEAKAAVTAAAVDKAAQ